MAMISITRTDWRASGLLRLARIATAVLVAAVSCLAAPGVRAAAESEAGATAVVDEMVKEVLAALRDKSVPTQKRIRSIEKIAYKRFDLDVMSRLVLARNWKRFSEEQKAQYVKEFKRYLTNRYGNRVERYDQQSVKIIGEREEPRGDVVVETKVVGGEFEGTSIDYRLRNQTGGWRVIDVVIENISMVSNLQEQFKSIVGRGGPELLLKKLRAKNAVGMAID